MTHAHAETGGAWWRPVQVQAVAPGHVADAHTPTSRVAFGALVAFTAILLLSPQIWFPILGSLRIAFLAAGLAIGAHLMQRLARPEPAPFFPEIAIAATLVSWAIITIPLSYWPGGSVEVLADRYLKAVAFFWLIGTVVTTTERVRVLAWAFVLCSIPLAITGIHHYLTGMFLRTGVPGLTRISGYEGGSGLVSNPNDLALMLNLILPIAGSLIVSAKSVSGRCVAAIAAALGAVAVVLTFSRAGFLTLATTSLLFTWWLLRRRAPGKAAVLLIAGLCTIPLMPKGYADRLSTITDIEADQTGSAEGRWRDYQVALGVIAQNPIFGAGIGQDILAMNESRGDDWVSVHNAFLEYAVDLGIPGLVLFVWLYITCVRSARKVERQALAKPAAHDLAALAGGVRIALLAFAVAACFHPIAYQFYFFSIGGLAIALKHAYLTEHASAPAVARRQSSVISPAAVAPAQALVRVEAS